MTDEQSPGSSNNLLSRSNRYRVFDGAWRDDMPIAHTKVSVTSAEHNEHLYSLYMRRFVPRRLSGRFECDACSGAGFWHDVHLDFECAICDGRGYYYLVNGVLS